MYAPLLFRLGITSLLVCLIGGCTPGKVVYQAAHNGLDFVVKAHETRTWSGSRTDWILKLKGHPELPIIITKRWGTPVEPDEVVSTDWGPPYSDAIYSTFGRMYPGNAPAYTNNDDDSSDSTARWHDYTMLYMPFGSDAEDFAAYSALMKAECEWTAVDKTLTSNDGMYFSHLIGLVNAPRERFIQRFRGSKNSVKHIVRINPDGYVNFGLTDGSADWNHDRHSPVQMPGKEILVPMLYNIEAEGWQLADFQNMTDRKGKRVEACFRIKE